MFRMFRKPVSALDEKKLQNNYVIQNHVPDSPKRNAPLVSLQTNSINKKSIEDSESVSNKLLLVLLFYK